MTMDEYAVEPKAFQTQSDPYLLRSTIRQLQHALGEATTRNAIDEWLIQLSAALDRLRALERNDPATRSADSVAGRIASVVFADKVGAAKGAMTTGLTADVRLCMKSVPTGIFHLLDVERDPLVEGYVKNHSSVVRRLRMTTYIEGYSARAVDTVELAPGNQGPIVQLPTLFPHRLRDLNELTRATLNVLIEDLDGSVENHTTAPIWLLARNSVPLAVRDPGTGSWKDLSRYLGAYVTPNEPSVMGFLRRIARHHPQGQLFGYQQAVEPQVRAVFQALKEDVDITYVNSVLNFTAEESARTQRVRLPRQSLDEAQANCLDGALLFASLLEAASLNPALVIVPGHALIGWQLHPRLDQWDYLETTMIGSHSFEEALDIGRRKAKSWQEQAVNDPRLFLRWSLRDLRTEHAITPLE